MVNPTITGNEFKDVCSRLKSRGLSESQVHDVQKIFRGDLDEAEDKQKGVDPLEFRKAVAWLRQNKSKHSLQDRHIDDLEKLLKERL